ncbi:acyltransferase family protein [Acinetobacter pittii]|uniref:acyltransferase family protein n=1 Tax=Acinetobacter pittii TaxID=48296 RepID=UPI001F434C0E|nr:acyltransferase [Acinetobacter pittii]MCF1281325.1 acyltransferase [Acinetobacter pittii]
MLNHPVRKNNFDFFRIYLASVVFFAHYYYLTQISYPYDKSFFLFNSGFAVNAFFVVSGYLITKSWIKSHDLKKYVKSRAKRIFPLYLLILFLCFFIGYIINFEKGFLNYLSNGALDYLAWNAALLNFMHPNLPYLFESNPFNTVNGSLWTIKLEVAFYVFVPIIYFFLKTRKSRVVGTICIYFLSAISFYILKYVASRYALPSELIYQIPSYLVLFMAGAIFNFIDFKKINTLPYFLLSILYFILFDYSLDRGLGFITPIMTAIFVIHFCEKLKFNIPIPKQVGDISYGIYILHFPVIQLMIQYDLIKYSYSVFYCYLIVVILSMISWHLFEKKILYSK